MEGKSKYQVEHLDMDFYMWWGHATPNDHKEAVKVFMELSKERPNQIWRLVEILAECEPQSSTPKVIKNDGF